ncbi:MAG: hypothetical protein WCX97_01140 [Candidatus Magasanikbacteria bacterium]
MKVRSFNGSEIHIPGVTDKITENTSDKKQRKPETPIKVFSPLDLQKAIERRSNLFYRKEAGEGVDDGEDNVSDEGGNEDGGRQLPTPPKEPMILDDEDDI